MTNYLPLPTVFFFPRQGQIIVYIGGNRYALIGSLYLFFQLLKGRIADRVFHPASLLFRRFLIDASSYKLFRKELVSLIDFFSNFPGLPRSNAENNRCLLLESRPPAKWLRLC